MQLQRFELKYLVDEDKALAVRDFVRMYLDVDEFGEGKPDFSYPVHSLYLDSDDLRLYQTTLNGDKNRFKLRLRYYDDREDSPVFFEIKRRLNNTIVKQRGGVQRTAVPLLLSGQFPERGHLLSPSAKSLGAVQRFCQLMQDLRARPKAHIAYQREAWINPKDNSVRVTLDRKVLCQPDLTGALSTRMQDPVHVFGSDVILELKFTNRFPDWFRELVRVFSIMQCGAAKYAEGVVLLGPDRIRQTERIDGHETAFHEFNQPAAIPANAPRLFQTPTP